jgi:hypothetical protein
MGASRVSNIVHSIAKMKLARNKNAMNILHELNKNAKWLVEEGDPQHVANSVWACAKLGVAAPMLFDALNKNDKWLVEGDPQNVANSVWACATLGVAAPMLFNALNKNAK